MTTVLGLERYGCSLNHNEYLEENMETPFEMVDWKSPTLKKGQGMGKFCGENWMSIDHTDRTVDPYLAGVQHGGRYIYSGLHTTLAAARQVCESIAKEYV